MKPTVLVFATSPWISSAKLAMALANSGWTVMALCASPHPLRAVRAVARTHTYHFLRPIRSISNAITRSRPDLIIPADDLAVFNLHNLYTRACHDGKDGENICTLIERSLGAPASFSISYKRADLMTVAAAEGIRVPETSVVSTTEALHDRISEWGLPVFLKADNTSGGSGVKIISKVESANPTFCALQAPPGLIRAIKRILINGETALLWPALLRERYILNAQVYVEGREVTSTIACWQGKVIGSLQFEVIHRQFPLGPATVFRAVENSEITAVGEKLAGRLQLSGLHGFDFILSNQNGAAFLLEMNPRATQVGHLTLGPGRDLPAALYAAFTGQSIQPSPPLTENDTIAIFPHEWIRNPASKFLESAYHDVPWNEPALVLAGIRERRKHNVWLTRQKWIEVFSLSRGARP